MNHQNKTQNSTQNQECGKQDCGKQNQNENKSTNSQQSR